jgi:hypothetical protein
MRVRSLQKRSSAIENQPGDDEARDKLDGRAAEASAAGVDGAREGAEVGEDFIGGADDEDVGVVAGADESARREREAESLARLGGRVVKARGELWPVFEKLVHERHAGAALAAGGGAGGPDDELVLAVAVEIGEREVRGEVERVCAPDDGGDEPAGTRGAQIRGEVDAPGRWLGQRDRETPRVGCAHGDLAAAREQAAYLRRLEFEAGRALEVVALDEACGERKDLVLGAEQNLVAITVPEV